MAVTAFDWSYILLVVLLLIGGIIIGIGLVRELGVPGVEQNLRCPSCANDRLGRVDTAQQYHERLAVLRCDHCGTSFQRQVDGTLVTLPSDFAN